MSLVRECEFFEHRPGKWYFILEHCDSPKNVWDWTEDGYSDVVGPFPTQEEASDYLHSTEVNPGGYSILPYVEVEKDGPRYDAFVARATKPRSYPGDTGPWRNPRPIRFI